MLKGFLGAGEREIEGFITSRNPTPSSASTQSGFKPQEIPSLLTGSQNRETAYSL